MTETANTTNLLKFDANSDYHPLELYSIYDKKVSKYLPPFFCANRDDAIRQIKNVVNYTPSLINKFPQDYSLYFVGYFNEKDATILNLSEFICDLNTYVVEDTVKYDDLKKEIQEQKFIVQNSIAQLDKLKETYENKMKDLSVLYNKYNNSVELYEPKNHKNSVKKGLIKSLFSH